MNLKSEGRCTERIEAETGVKGYFRKASRAEIFSSCCTI